MKFSAFILLGILTLVSCSKSGGSGVSSENDKRIEAITPERVKVQINATNDEEILSLESRRTRDQQFEYLLDDRLNLSSRILAAKTYFSSFDYQIRHNIKKNDVLEALYFEATNEFSRRIPEIFEQVNAKKLSPFKAKNKMTLSFYALAASLDESNLSISMLDIMKKALIKEKVGKELLRHEEPLVIKDNKEISIELLKARVDIMTALALENLTDKKNMTLGQKTKTLLFKVTGGLFGSIDLPELYDESNEATKKAAKDYLSAALRTKNFLTEIGIKKDLNKTLRSALKKIDFSEKSEHDEMKEEIKGLIIKLLEA